MEEKVFSFVLSLVISLNVSVFAQEICDNAVDDDGDGLIDLNDNDCNCSNATIVQSLIPNPSFEEYGYDPTYMHGKLPLALPWIQGSSTTTDLLYENGFDKFLPSPYPEGKAAIGMMVIKQWQEYAAVSPNSKLKANTAYKLKCHVNLSATGYVNGVPCNNIAIDAIDLVIFGKSDGTIGGPSTLGCPTSVPTANWIKLGSVKVNPNVGWYETTIEFTPTQDIDHLIFGSQCNLPASYPTRDANNNISGPHGYCVPYLGLDNLILNEKDQFGPSSSLKLSSQGGLCTNDLVLNTKADTNTGDWQWYKDGIAILGATNDNLKINKVDFSGGAPIKYTARHTFNGSCTTKDTTITYSSNVTAKFDVKLSCSGYKIELIDLSTTKNGTITSWSWDFTSDGTSDDQGQNSGFQIPQNGQITTTLVVIDNNGCKDTSIQSYNPASGQPKADFSIKTNCSTGQVELTDASTTGASGLLQKWHWDFTSNGITDGQGQTAVFSPANGVSQISSTLIVTTDQGCADTITKQYYMQGTALVIDTINSCNPIVWRDGRKYSQDNSTATFTVTNPQGCDTTYQLNLSMNNMITAIFNWTGACEDSPCIFNDLSNVGNGNVTSWKWDFGDGNSSKLANPSNTYGNLGTYTVKMVITTDKGCIDSVQQSVQIHSTPKVAISSYKENCGVVCLQLEPEILPGGPSAIPEWLWTFPNGDTSSLFKPEFCFVNRTDSMVVYGVRLKAVSIEGCQTMLVKDSIVSVWPIPRASFSSEYLWDEYKDLRLDLINTSSADVSSFDWRIDREKLSSDESPSITIENDTSRNISVALKVSNDYGCEDSIHEYLVINEPYSFYVPNAFSPNGDGKNDLFKPVFAGVSRLDYDMMIINRWGHIVFQTTNLNEGWNGDDADNNDAQQDSYIWISNVADPKTGVKKKYTGHVNLIR